jgi:cadmium resistance protein CadD (predicted permease)
MPYLSLLLLGLVAFVSTDIDDLLLLVLLFADRRLSSRQVVLGQYLGFLGLLVVSLACSLLAIVIPAHWLGLLGLWPLLVGLKRLWLRPPEDVVGASAESAASSVGICTVAFITLANGGDNITVYVPLFAGLGVMQVGILVSEFLVLVAIWCLIARFLVTHPVIGGAIRRVAHAILPYVLIGLGAWILLRSLTGSL